MKDKMKQLLEYEYGKRVPNYFDSKIPEDISSNTPQAFKIREFFCLLAVCHTVLVEPDPNNPEKVLYKAQSPDEEALVNAARDVGFTCLNRTDNKVDIDLLGKKRTYTILNIMEFNSDRKRMSVIIKRPEGDIVLLCKGADSVIFERLNKSLQTEAWSKTLEHLQIFANDGLRTLCLAFRQISSAEYKSWRAKYIKAQAVLVDREIECDKVADEIEKDMELMGATAIEDKLQDGVPETIQKLAQAGIKIWVLTGDKVETAINIGFSCNLLTKTMILIIIQAPSKRETLYQLKNALDKFWDSEGRARDEGEFGLVCDGQTLKFALEPPCRELFLELGCRCNSVLCCRVSPLQKSLVVRLVRKGLNAMCLAIGDGANDVSMIQEADIGVGINGKEGLQAVMASDYAIAQFRFLARLLLVHGRWSYLRISELVLHSFYKNMLWLLIQFWYQFYSSFTASLPMDFTYSMFLNTIFTSLTTVAVGIFDQDISDRMSLKFPQIYQKGIFQKLYSYERYWIYMANATWQSLVCYYGVYIMYEGMAVTSDGANGAEAASGTLMAFTSIFIINLSGAVSWHTWNIFNWVSFLLSCGLWIAYLAIYACSPGSPIYQAFAGFLASPLFYLVLILLITICFIPRLVFKYIQTMFWPTDIDILKEAQQKFGTIDMEASDSVPDKIEDELITKISTQSKDQHEGSKELLAESGEDGFGSPPRVPSKSKVLQMKNESSRAKDRSNSIERQGQLKHSRTASVLSLVKTGAQRATKFMLGIKPPMVEKRASIYYANTNETVPNTGFAFSQEAGMSSLITPINTNAPTDTESEASSRRGTGSRIFGRERIRSMANSIRSALRITSTTKESGSTESISKVRKK